MLGFSDCLQLFVKQALQPLTIKGPQLLGRMRNAEGVVFAITKFTKLPPYPDSFQHPEKAGQLKNPLDYLQPWPYSHGRPEYSLMCPARCLASLASTLKIPVTS